MTTTTSVIITIVTTATIIVTRNIGIVIPTYIAVAAWFTTFLFLLTTFLLFLVRIGTYRIILASHV